MVIATIVFFNLTLLTRLWPLLYQPHRGSDAYYFLLCRKIFRQNWRLPIVLPDIYALEDREQAYPPGFTIFLSLFPDRIIDRYYWCISPVMDAVICGGVVMVTAVMFHSVVAALVAGVVYLFSLSSFQETQNLTSRQLGALLFGVTVMGSIVGYHHQSIFISVLAVSSGGLLLLTHKLSTQALLAGFWCIALLFLNWSHFFYPVIIFVVAMVVSGGYYLKIVRGHVDIVSFWTRNWSKLGAHQVNSSPIYGSMASEEEASSFWMGNLGFLHLFFRQNLYFLICMGAVLWHMISPFLSNEQMYLLCWTCAVAALGIMSYLVPLLRGIGFGLQYGKLALIPGAVFCGSAFLHPSFRVIVVVFLCALIYVGVKYYWRMVGIARSGSASKGGWDIEALQGLFACVKKLRRPYLMCVPNSMCDLIAYHCRVRVHWGSHGYPFAKVAHILPVLLKSIPNIGQEFGVTHLLLDCDYTNPRQLNLEKEPVWVSSNLALYALDDS